MDLKKAKAVGDLFMEAIKPYLDRFPTDILKKSKAVVEAIFPPEEYARNEKFRWLIDTYIEEVTGWIGQHKDFYEGRNVDNTGKVDWDALLKKSGQEHFPSRDDFNLERDLVDGFCDEQDDEWGGQYVHGMDDEEDWDEEEESMDDLGAVKEKRGRPKKKPGPGRPKGSKTRARLQRGDSTRVIPVPRVSEAYSVIKRVMRFNGAIVLNENSSRKVNGDKIIMLDQLFAFVKRINLHFLTGKITKDSEGVENVLSIRDNVVRFIDNFPKGKNAGKAFEIKPETIEAFKGILRVRPVMKSVPLLKEFVRLTGNNGVQDEAAILHEKIAHLFEEKLINTSDPRYWELKKVRDVLAKYKRSTADRPLQITKETLRGLNES